MTNTCELFTRETDSFECESQTNLSQVWKFRTYLSHLWRIRVNFFTYVINTCESFTSVKDLHVFVISVIRTHGMCDKFIKMSICSAFLFWEEHSDQSFKTIRPVVLNEMRKKEMFTDGQLDGKTPESSQTVRKAPLDYVQKSQLYQKGPSKGPLNLDSRYPSMP